MTTMTRTWDRLTLPGKALAILLPLLAVLTLGLIVTIVLFGQTILDVLIYNLPIVRFVFAATILLLLAPPTSGSVRTGLGRGGRCCPPCTA